GGAPREPQIRALDRGIDVVVATPGRALDHIRRTTLKLDGIATVVLDEADEMLDMGFAEDIETILAETPKARQTALFSATMPPRIQAIAGQHLTNPVEVHVKRDPVAAGAVPKVRQTAFVVPRQFKLAALGRVLDAEAPTAALIFCRTRSEVDELTDLLGARGYRPEPLHGGMAQDQRDRVMRLFRAGQANLLVATDVAARGLDVDHLTHVVNFSLPMGTEAYVHRIGRVGRAGREGVALTIAEPREQGALRSIERTTGLKIDYGRVPTAADLKVKRLERLKATIRETVAGGDLDQYRALFGSLVGELDPTEVALAALKLAHLARGGNIDDGPDIPVSAPPVGRGRVRRRGGAPT
ncbi:MAG: DEAD/DEAH box helicase, partial [Thermoleophilia bacterium]|nr:DEAD/DEAH box helicase [Thermoleophilia bacterium]